MYLPKSSVTFFEMTDENKMESALDSHALNSNFTYMVICSDDDFTK